MNTTSTSTTTAKSPNTSAIYHVIFTADRLHSDAASAQHIGHMATGEPLWVAQVRLIAGYSGWEDVANILTIAHPHLDNITPVYAQNGTDTQVAPTAAVHWF